MQYNLKGSWFAATAAVCLISVSLHIVRAEPETWTQPNEGGSNNAEASATSQGNIEGKPFLPPNFNFNGPQGPFRFPPPKWNATDGKGPGEPFPFLLGSINGSEEFNFTAAHGPFPFPPRPEFFAGLRGEGFPLDGNFSAFAGFNHSGPHGPFPFFPPQWNISESNFLNFNGSNHGFPFPPPEGFKGPREGPFSFPPPNGNHSWPFGPFPFPPPFGNLNNSKPLNLGETQGQFLPPPPPPSTGTQ